MKNVDKKIELIENNNMENVEKTPLISIKHDVKLKKHLEEIQESVELKSIDKLERLSYETMEIILAGKCRNQAYNKLEAIIFELGNLRSIFLSGNSLLD